MQLLIHLVHPTQYSFARLLTANVHVAVVGVVNTTMFDRLISLALTTRQSYQAWCQFVHNFSIEAAHHR